MYKIILNEYNAWDACPQWWKTMLQENNLVGNKEVIDRYLTKNNIVRKYIENPDHTKDCDSVTTILFFDSEEDYLITKLKWDYYVPDIVN